MSNNNQLYVESVQMNPGAGVPYKVTVRIIYDRSDIRFNINAEEKDSLSDAGMLAARSMLKFSAWLLSDKKIIHLDRITPNNVSSETPSYAVNGRICHPGGEVEVTFLIATHCGWDGARSAFWDSIGAFAGWLERKAPDLAHE